MDIHLDKQTLKALSSSTRVEVLRVLNRRRHMQSEIATELSLAVPTIKAHLDELEEAGLVIRFDEGRKWKYYGLTIKGKSVLNPQERKILLVLGLFIFSMIGSMISFVKSQPQVAEKMAFEISAQSLAEQVAQTAVVGQTAVVASGSQGQSVVFWLFALLALLAALSLIVVGILSGIYGKKLSQLALEKETYL